jgi:hypothetical protein
MKALILYAALAVSFLPLLHAQAQPGQSGQTANPEAVPTNDDDKQDVPSKDRFWQATVGGGHYMIALDRISAISRHKYILNGNLIVDEVTVDSIGNSLVRFYFISPITDAMGGTNTGNAASRIVDRGREIVDKVASTVGTDAHEMVQKNYPDTTHAHTIEYRVQSAQELGALYGSVRTAWETGRGRRFTVK